MELFFPTDFSSLNLTFVLRSLQKNVTCCKGCRGGYWRNTKNTNTDIIIDTVRINLSALNLSPIIPMIILANIVITGNRK